MSWDELMQHICFIETENDDLQRQLSEAKDYIEHMESGER